MLMVSDFLIYLVELRSKGVDINKLEITVSQTVDGVHYQNQVIHVKNIDYATLDLYI